MTPRKYVAGWKPRRPCSFVKCWLRADGTTAAVDGRGQTVRKAASSVWRKRGFVVSGVAETRETPTSKLMERPRV